MTFPFMVQGLRRYQVRYSVHGEDGTYMSKDRTFRSLRQAGEFIVSILKDRNLEFGSIHAVEVQELTEKEQHALYLFTDGELDLRK